MTHKFQNLHKDVKIYREMPKGRKSPKSELGEQIDSYQWFKVNHFKLEQELFYVPNETQGQKDKKGKLTGKAFQHQKRMSEAGRSSGVSDLILLHQTDKYPYAVIEMKAKFHGSPSKEEKLFLNHHADKGAFVCICWGFEQFKIAVKEFLQE